MSSIPIEEEYIVVVPSAEDMNSLIFCRHMNLRHQDSLGGLDRLRHRYLSEYVEDCYRSFHHRLHQVRVDLDHEHEED